MIRTTLSTGQDNARHIMTEQSHIMACPRSVIPSLYRTVYATTEDPVGGSELYTLDAVLFLPQAPILFNQGGREYLYAVHIDDQTNTVWWENLNEWFHRQDLFKNHRVLSYDFGYVIGTMHPMGPAIGSKGMISERPIHGYHMWYKAECIR